MKLSRIRIKNFRSISETTLDRVAGFNVLIGRNNSGKSNILSCIEMSMKFLRINHVAGAKPPISRIDFYARDTTKPIEILVEFTTSIAERDAIVGSIITSQPEFRTLIEGIDLAPTLAFHIKTSQGDPHILYIAQATLEARASADQSPSTTLLSMSNDTAREVFKNQQDAEDTALRLAIFSRLRDVEGEQWTRTKEIAARDPTFLRYQMSELFEGAEPPRAILAAVAEKIKNASSGSVALSDGP
jgi:putative ATP-dependent endonuclease of OLD family